MGGSEAVQPLLSEAMDHGCRLGDTNPSLALEETVLPVSSIRVCFAMGPLWFQDLVPVASRETVRVITWWQHRATQGFCFQSRRI